MRSILSIRALAAFFALAAVLTAYTVIGAEKPAPAHHPSPTKPGMPGMGFPWTSLTPGMPPQPGPMPPFEKLKELGSLLARTLDLTADLFSGNKAELLAKNKAALLSGNRPTILSGNKTKVLSDNETPIFSGNSFSLFSNIKVEIHIDHSGNNVTAGPAAQPQATREMRPFEPGRTPAPRK